MEKDKNVKAWTVWQAKENAYIKKLQPKKIADLVISGVVPFAEQMQ